MKARWIRQKSNIEDKQLIIIIIIIEGRGKKNWNVTKNYIYWKYNKKNISNKNLIQYFVCTFLIFVYFSFYRNSYTDERIILRNFQDMKHISSREIDDFGFLN